MKTKEGVKCERLFDESLISVADQVLQRGRRAGAAVGTEHVVHHRTITRNGQGKSGWSGESTKCLSFISLGKERERERAEKERESVVPGSFRWEAVLRNWCPACGLWNAKRG